MAELVVERYSNAIFEVGKENNCLNTLKEQIENFLMADIRDLEKFIANPCINAACKIELFQKIFTGDEYNIFLGSVASILKKHRGVELIPIFKSFLNKYKAYQNLLDVQVVSAYTLSEMQLDKIKAILVRKTGKNINLICIIDKEVISGFIIKSDSFTIDCSIRSSMDELKSRLLNTDFM